MNYAVYTTSTGHIEQLGNAPDSTAMALQAQTGQTAASCSSSVTFDYWYNGSAFALKPTLDTICSLTNTGGWLANGSDTISYGTALPNPTVVAVTCDNPIFNSIDPTSITSGTVTLTTTAPGNYTITLTAPMYLTKTISVSAT